MTTIFFYLEMRLPDENELHDLLKRRMQIGGSRQLSGAGSLYGPYRRKCLNDAATLIRAYFRKYGMAVPQLPKLARCRMRFDWYEQDRRRDPDNIAAGGRKIILDALRLIGILPNDGWAQIVKNDVAFLDCFHVRTESEPPGVQVFIQCYEVGERIQPL